MQYMLMIYEDESAYGARKDNDAFKAMVARHMAFAKELGDKRVGGAGLKGTHTATTVATRTGGQVLHDGPFAEAREQLAGFYIVEAAHLDEAIAIAKKVPLYAEGAIEVRPLIERA